MMPAPKAVEREERERFDGVDESGDKQVLGKQLWRIFPFIKPYKGRFVLGIVSNSSELTSGCPLHFLPSFIFTF